MVSVNIVRKLNENVEEYLLLVLFSAIIILIGSETFRRFVFENTTVWGTQTAIFLYAIASWIGVSYAARRRLHLKITVLQERFPPSTRIAVITIGNLLFIALMVQITYYSYQIMLLQRKFGRTMFGVPELKIYYFYVPIVVAAALTVVRIAQNIREDIRVYRSKREFVTGTPLFVNEE